MTRLREVKKAEKNERIRLAALRLFAERGYEATTMRDVAREAKVALGTLSLYATDKRDLTLLVFNERIATLTAEAIKARYDAERRNIVEALSKFFSFFYRDWEKNSTLARIFLQVNYYSRGMHSEEYQKNRQDVLSEINFIVEQARSNNEIETQEDSRVIAQHFFLLFSAAARWWIAEDKPIAEAGIEQLRRLIHLQVVGLSPAEAGKKTKQTASGRIKPIDAYDAFSRRA